MERRAGIASATPMPVSGCGGFSRSWEAPSLGPEEPASRARLVVEHGFDDGCVDRLTFVGVTVDERGVAEQIDDSRDAAADSEDGITGLGREEVLPDGAGDGQPVPDVGVRLLL